MTYQPLNWSGALSVASPERVGAVTAVLGLGVQARGLRCAVGDVVTINNTDAEVVAIAEDTAHIMPLAPLLHTTIGTPVHVSLSAPTVPTGVSLLGRVVDGLGRPIDGKGPLMGATRVPYTNAAPNALERTRISEPLQTGVRVVDTLTSVGRGQRLGLFAGSGVGKSSLLSMMARGTEATVSVIALVGERGREVREFLEDDLGPEGLSHSVVVVATSDEPALMRLRSAFTATRIAESFREQGQDVLLMMDSLTRVAMAQREIGLSAGEPPATRGYPPSTFATLAGLLERAGTDAHGSVTGIYTVLVDGDDHNEPVADAVRSILDGHIVLDRKLAVAGHFPSIDALGSISRVASKVCTPEQKRAATLLRKVLAAKKQAQDLIDVGAYQPGSNSLVDLAVSHDAAIASFLQQGMDEQIPIAYAWELLNTLTNGWEGV